jgi:hypothetical protein
MSMRNTILSAVYKHAEGHIAKHRANIEVYLHQPVGIGEHSNIVEAIELELKAIAEYQDQIEILNNYFPLEKEILI